MIIRSSSSDRVEGCDDRKCFRRCDLSTAVQVIAESSMCGESLLQMCTNMYILAGVAPEIAQCNRRSNQI